MTKRRLWRLLALFFAFSLVAAACGSDDDDASDSDVDTQTTAATDSDSDSSSDSSSDSDDSSDDDDMSEVTEVDVPPVPTNPDRSTLEGIFEEAAARRANIVATLTNGIASGEYGVGADNVLRGPGGFEVDLSTCPDDWDNANGITDSEIRIGHTTAQSGNLAAYGNIAVGWETLLDWINENDPIQVDGSDRELVLLVKDDAYVSAQTIEFIDELIESENVFTITTLGSPNTLAVYDKLNDECIPQPYVMTGHPAWGDPVNHPWTTGLQLAYSTESILWGNWIRDNIDDLPVKVAGLVMDNDFGLAYELGFEEWAHANPDVVSEFFPVRHDPAAPTLTNEITTIAASDPDVFISMTAGNPCLLAIQEVDSSGLLDELDAAFTPSVCKGIAAYMAPAGDSADDWWIVGGGGKDSTDPKHVNEPFIMFVNENLENAGLDISVSLYAVGYTYGYPHAESLRIASELPGGLTRTNFILAVRSTEIYHPMLLDGISFSANGVEDSYFVEGSDYSRFDADAQSWNIIGDIVDANGASPNCAWDKDRGGCR